jgi:transcriptional regulator with XRE-family HTH domain
MFYDVYAELCQKAGEKPYAVAALCGAKSNSSVAQWQKGSVPRQPILQKIADHFGVSIDYLLTGEEKSPAAEAAEPRPVTDEDIKFALFGGAGEITNEMYDEVKAFAQFVRQRHGK